MKREQLYKHTVSVLVLLSGVCVHIHGSELVWRSQPRARSSISRYVLDAGYIYSELRRWTRTLPQRWRSCRRCSKGEIPVNLHVRIQIIVISSCSDYSRVASISFQGAAIYYSRAASIQERRLFGHIQYTPMGDAP